MEETIRTAESTHAKADAVREKIRKATQALMALKVMTEKSDVTVSFSHVSEANPLHVAFESNKSETAAELIKLLTFEAINTLGDEKNRLEGEYKQLFNLNS